MIGRKKMLITGGLGNLGSWLTEYFSYKYDVFVLSKSARVQLDCKYTLIQADIASADDLRMKLNIEFDYCIHAASYNESFHPEYAEKALKINTLGTRNLVDILKDTKIKNFIYLSTYHVYGVNSGLITENTELNPKNDYASTHLFAEYYLKQFFYTHNFRSIILRLTNCYGSPKYINSTKWYLILNDLTKSAYENGIISLTGSGKELRDLVWMGDVCTTVEDMLDVAFSDTYNLSSGRTYNMRFLAEKVKKVYEGRYVQKIDIVVNKVRKSDNFELKICNNKIKKNISFEFNDKVEEEINSIFDLLEKCAS